jgi:hypothetical protein
MLKGRRDKMKKASQFGVRINAPSIAQIMHGPREHIYEIGEKVMLDARGGYVRNLSDTFSVLAQLPPVGDDLQYRIKSVNEPHERVVAEHQLKPVLLAAN